MITAQFNYGGVENWILNEKKVQRGRFYSNRIVCRSLSAHSVRVPWWNKLLNESISLSVRVCASSLALQAGRRDARRIKYLASLSGSNFVKWEKHQEIELRLSLVRRPFHSQCTPWAEEDKWEQGYFFALRIAPLSALNGHTETKHWFSACSDCVLSLGLQVDCLKFLVNDERRLNGGFLKRTGQRRRNKIAIEFRPFEFEIKLSAVYESK